jgi:hypothetical protein
MAPLDITVGQLIDQIERDLPDADPVTRVGEARKQARVLGDLGDQLIDHFIQAARRAGASWSQIGDAMGVSKQAAQQRGAPAGRFSRFTDRARKVVAASQTIAREQRHSTIEPEHLLVALLRATGGMAAKIIEAYGADPAELAENVQATLPPAGEQEPGEHIPFSAASKKLLEETVESTLDLDNNYVGTEHILLGVLRMPDTAAARVLIDAGIDHARARDMVAAALMGFQEGDKKRSQAWFRRPRS